MQPAQNDSSGQAALAVCLYLAMSGTATAALSVDKIGEYRSDAPFDGAGVEKIAYYAGGGRHRAYVVNDTSASVDIISLDDPMNPTFLLRVDLSMVQAMPTDGPTDVAADPLGRGVAVTVINSPPQSPGWVVFLDLDGALIDAVTVGALPASMAFTPDGSRLLIGNEGTPDTNYLSDPEGSVSILDVSGGFLAPPVSTARLAAIPEVGNVRHFGPNAAFPEVDFEPENIVVTDDGRRAFVTLQEHNAIAELDVLAGAFVRVTHLGFKDHSLPGFGLDPSDRDNAALVRNWPVSGMYQPGGMALLNLGGINYLLTANEGKSRNYAAYSERVQVRDLMVEPPLDSDLLDSENLGRLEVTTTLGDADANLLYEALYSFGGRSFSIWDTDFSSLPAVYDSGDEFEQRTAVIHPADFNSEADANMSFDRRSHNKGPEPEAVVTGSVCGRNFAFISFEHMGGVMVFDVTEPTDVSYVLYRSSRNFAVVATDPAAGGLGAGALAYVDAADSPAGDDLLLLANEVSGTLEVFRVTDPLCSGCVGGGPLRPRRNLLGYRDGVGATFEWSDDPAATEYHLNTVEQKRRIDPVWVKQRPIGIGVTQCSSPAPGCTDPDATTDPATLLFYQALSACGPSASEEGPVF